MNVRALLFAVASFGATATAAAPFVVADISPGTTQCGWMLDSQFVEIVAADVGGATCRYDLSGVGGGTHSITVVARADAVVSEPSLAFRFRKRGRGYIPV